MIYSWVLRIICLAKKWMVQYSVKLCVFLVIIIVIHGLQLDHGKEISPHYANAPMQYTEIFFTS